MPHKRRERPAWRQLPNDVVKPITQRFSANTEPIESQRLYHYSDTPSEAYRLYEQGLTLSQVAMKMRLKSRQEASEYIRRYEKRLLEEPPVA